MSERRTEPPQQLRRRRRRLLGTLPVAAIAWGSLVVLPAQPAAPQAGTVHTEIIDLTGPQATTSADGGVATNAAPAPEAATAGWSTLVDVDDGTQAVAASWQGAAEGVVSVRGRDGDGWTEWTALESEPEERPDDAQRYSGGMAWFGIDGIDEVEVRVDAGPLVDLEVQPIRYEEPSSGGLVLGAATAGASTAGPTILPRSSYTSKGWQSSNPGCATGPITAAGGVRLAVVHHTVNSNTYASADVPAMLAAINAFHTGTNRWCDTGYNFIVDRFGRLWEGRSGGIDKAIVGGHAAGFNTGTVGVAFLGQHEPGASPTVAQPSSSSISAAAKLIGWKLGLGGIDPTGSTAFTSGGSNKYPAGTVVTLPRVVGHRDVGATACPGQNLYSQLGAIRTGAKAAQATTTTAPTTTTIPVDPPPQFAPFFTAAQLVTQQYADVLRRDPSAADLEYWTSRVGTSWPPGQFIAHLTASGEADDRVHAVTRLYQAYFLRTPDYAGLNFWLNKRGEGRTLVSISQSFATSSEFQRRYGSLSNAGFVDRVYRNVLGRAPDANGLTYWTARLNGGVPRGQVMANFSQSSEFVRNTQEGVWVVGIYAALLKRAPDADVYELLEASLRNSSSSLTSVAGYVYNTDEYRDRFR